MPLAEDMKNIVEDIISSYEARIQGIGAIFDGTHQLLEGFQEGLQEGLQEGHQILLGRLLVKKYQQSSESITALLKGLRPTDLIELGEYLLDCSSFDEIRCWIQQRKQGNLS